MLAARRLASLNIFIYLGVFFGCSIQPTNQAQVLLSMQIVSHHNTAFDHLRVLGPGFQNVCIHIKLQYH
jgi:hypothetical protein